MNRIVCVGEALVDFVAQTEVADVAASEYFRRAAGGAVANVAVGIARLGGRAIFAGTLGKDPFGKFLLRTLAHEGVEVDAVRLVDAATTLAFVARGPAGARDFAFVRSPGADSQLERSDLDEAALARAAALHFGGVLLATEPARSACLAAAQAAHGAGALVSFDPNARPPLFASAAALREALLAGCRAATLVKCSDDDLAALNMAADPRALLGGRTQAAVVTLGARGCRWVLAGGESGDARAAAVEAVDTTGAGDAFMAALLWRIVAKHGGRLSRGALEDAASYACAAGAAACRVEGAIPSLPHPADVERLLHGAA